VRGQEVVGERERFNSVMGSLKDIPEAFYKLQPKLERNPMPVIDDARRVSTFDEVESGYSEAAARAEAERCLQCGCGAAEDCALRDYSTEYGASQTLFCGAKRREFEIDDTHPLVHFETGKCIQCGTCVRLLNEKFNDYSLGFANRGFTACVKPPFGQSLGQVLKDPERSQAIVGACPTGALMGS
jgi:formate dehydrogenase major subunit